MKVLNYEGLQLYHELASEEFANAAEVEAALKNLDDRKVDKDGNKVLSTNDYSTEEKNKLAGIASGAEVNQNAFGNVVVGSTTIAADSKTDTLTFVAGTNITLTPDAANDKITIAAKDTTYSTATISSSGLMSADDKTKLDNAVDKLNGIANGAQVNQNAFSNITDGTTTIAADSTTDTLTLAAGSNISLSLDATNDKVTISATNTTYDAAGSSLGLVKSGGDVTISNGVITVKDDSHNHTNYAQSSTVTSISNKVDTLENNVTAIKKIVDISVDNPADETINTISEIIGYIEDNEDAISIITNKQDKITGAATSITDSDLTASRVLVSDSNGKVAASSNITTTELNQLNGINTGQTIQNQLDKKASLSVATTSANGLMSSSDKSKLEGIAAGANNYSLPTASSSLGGVKTTSTVTSTSGLTACPIISGVVYYKDTDTNTHYTTRLYAGASGTAANAAATDPYLKVTDDNTYRNQIQFKGGGATTVSSDANGVITISSTDTNTNTDTKVTQSRSISSSYRPLLMHYTYGDYGADVGQATDKIYYNETIAAKASTGEIKATSFVGSGASLTSLNASNISSGTIAADRLPAATSSAYGAVKIGYTQSGKNYPVQLSNGQMYVNVPWTDNNTTYTFTNKAATLAWNTTSTIATVGGIDITVKMPANPDTNTTYAAGTGLTLSGTTFSLSTVPVTSGGTGATSKSGARTNLGINSGTSLPSSGTAGDIFFLYS